MPGKGWRIPSFFPPSNGLDVGRHVDWFASQPATAFLTSITLRLAFPEFFFSPVIYLPTYLSVCVERSSMCVFLHSFLSLISPVSNESVILLFCCLHD